MFGKKKCAAVKFQLTFIIIASFISNTASATELVLYNWEDYISSDVIQQFENETGHTIKLLTFDSDDKRDQVIASGTEGIDLVIIDTISTKLFGKNNILLPVENIIPDPLRNTQKKWRESCGNFGVPYLWGTLGIVYRQDKISTTPDSWADLIYPKKEVKNHINMLLDVNDTLVPSLKLLGLSVNSEKEEGLKSSYKMLLDQKKSVLTYDYVISHNKKNEDSIHMALAYSGDQYILNSDIEDEPWVFTTPKEGTSIWLDCLTILSSSKKQKVASEFIEFLNNPEIAAQNAEDLWVATPNYLATKHLSDEFLEDNSVYPSEETLSKSEVYRILSNSAIRQRNRIIQQLQRN